MIVGLFVLFTFGSIYCRNWVVFLGFAVCTIVVSYFFPSHYMVTTVVYFGPGVGISGTIMVGTNDISYYCMCIFCYWVL